MNKLWIIIGITALAGVILSGAGLALGANTGGFYWRDGGLHLAGERGVQRLEYSNTEPITDIAINALSMEVRFVEGSVFGFEISHHSDRRVTYSLEGGVLYIRQQPLFTIFNFGFDFQREYILVSLPADAVLNDVNIHVTSGRLQIERLICQTFNAVHTSGNANINNLTAQNVTMHSTSGRITVNNITAPLATISATSGNVAVTNAQGITQLDLQVTSGNVRIGINGAESDYRLNLSATSGRIAVNGQRRGGGIFNGHAFYAVNARTTSGNIDIVFTG